MKVAASRPIAWDAQKPKPGCEFSGGCCNTAGAANAMSWDIGHFTKAQVDDLTGRVIIHRLS